MLVRRGYVAANARGASPRRRRWASTAAAASASATRAAPPRAGPLLERRECLLRPAVTLALGVVYGVDRVAVPLLAVNDRTPSYARGLRARIFHGATLCVGWLCLAEGETLAVALLLAAAGRRALALLAADGRGVGVGLRLYTPLYTARVARGLPRPRRRARKRNRSARLPVAATLAVFAI